MQHGLIKEINHLVISTTTTKKKGGGVAVREHRQPPLRWHGVIGKAGPVINPRPRLMQGRKVSRKVRFMADRKLGSEGGG